MAKVWNNTHYQHDKQVNVGSVAAGHTVLITDPTGTVSSYMVCKIGNTKLSINDINKSILLVNNVTGRVVLKHSEQKCVVVSATTELIDYNGEFTNVQR